MTFEKLLALLRQVAGCDCCAYVPDDVELLRDACPVDEDGDVDHTYGDDCTRDRSEAFRRILEAARELPR